MANYILIESTSRVIIHVTNEVKTPPTGTEYVTVSDAYDIGGGPWVLESDNVTKRVPTAQELEAYRDVVNPDRLVVRELRQASLNLYQASSTSPELKTFLVKFRNWVKEVS